MRIIELNCGYSQGHGQLVSQLAIPPKRGVPSSATINCFYIAGQELGLFSVITAAESSKEQWPCYAQKTRFYRSMKEKWDIAQ